MAELRQEAELALGHYLTLRRPPEYGTEGGTFSPSGDGWNELRFQNFWIGETAYWRSSDGQGNVGPLRYHVFAPFGFSGISTNRSGDNVDTHLLFPNTSLSRNFAQNAIQETWVAEVRVCWIQNLNDPQDIPTLLHEYVGQISSGSWGETEITLTCNSIVDAVGSDIPARSIQQRAVGNVPISGNVRL